MKRTMLAGLLSGIAMFIWSSIAHIVMPLGASGISTIPNEIPVLSSLFTALGDANGMYVYPGMDMSGSMKEYEGKLATNPSGILIYHPPGAKGMETRQLVTEFLTEMVEAFMIVLLLSATNLVTFGARAGFAAMVGILAAITTNIPYWNWYGFPLAYTIPYMSVEIVGFLIAGVVAALIMTRSKPVV
jgi:hypothetical protein